MNASFEGKVCLVTGAGTGIGAATAELVAARGARVAVVGLPTDPLQDTVDRIVEGGGKALAVVADVSDAAHVQQAVDRTVAELGGLDLAVNAAGIAGAEVLLHRAAGG